MIVIPPGTFLMGSDQSKHPNQKPAHKVTIAYSFAVSRFEVTRSQYFEFVEETGRSHSGSCWGPLQGQSGPRFKRRYDITPKDPGFAQDDEHPIVCVNWIDADAYAKWLSEKTGRTYRLLSEAEWEYVARGGNGPRNYWWGDNVSRSNLNYLGTGGADSWEFTAPVGKFPSNPFGVFDMHGNVNEWVADCAHFTYEGAPTDGSPWLDTKWCSFKGRVVASGQIMRIRRGGSWRSRRGRATSAENFERRGEARGAGTGIRIAREMESPPVNE